MEMDSAAGGIEPDVPRDMYGFPLNLTQAQAAARQRCDQTQEQQAKKWASYAAKGILPGAPQLKKLCRKVQLPSKPAWDVQVGRL